jgi:hypothetical protein
MEGFVGHEIQNQVSFGNCQLSQCSCGRGALKVKNKVILLSSVEVSQMSKIFSGLAQPAADNPSLSNKLNQLMGSQSWTDFSLPNN